MTGNLHTTATIDGALLLAPSWNSKGLMLTVSGPGGRIGTANMTTAQALDVGAALIDWATTLEKSNHAHQVD